MKNFFKNAKKSSKGITLIALVITIIVLLILAGISISMLSGDNSILQKATTAKTETEKAQIIENAQTDILGQQATNKGSNITKGQLATILNNYFETVNETNIPDEITNTSDIELTTLDNKYKINLSKIYKGKFSNNELSDLSKLQNYFRNNTFSELWDNENDTFKNNEILTDASTISFTDDYGNAENYSYEGIEYNSNKYILTEEDDTILEVNNFEIKDISNIKFNYKSELYVENNSLNFRPATAYNLKSISNIFEIEDFEIIIGDTSIFTMTKGFYGDMNDWNLHGIGYGETQVELTGKTSGKKITINILVN